MIANCTFGIFNDILQDCAYPPIAGVEGVSYAMNRKDIVSITRDSTNMAKITGLTLAPGTKAYKILGFKKEQRAGNSLVVSDTNPDRWAQQFKFEAWQIDAAAVLMLDKLSDIVVVVERKNKGVNGDGAFIILGLETGLYKTSDAVQVSDNSGKRVIEMATQSGEESSISSHVIDTGGLHATRLFLEELTQNAVI